MPSHDEKQYVIYSRKSKFTGKGESIENQIELCRQYIAVHFGEDNAKQALIYEDEGFSGGNLARPQFQKMMKDSHTIRFSAIVVYRLDRISRNIGDFAQLIEDLGDREIDFISLREQFDTSSPMGRAMMYIASVFSQLERETIAERIRDNMHELSKTGRWLGGTTPLGYKSEAVTYVTIDGKHKKACQLKEIPEEIHLVTLIFDQFLETGSLDKTSQFLMQRQYRTRRDKPFTRFAIRGILSNPVYMIADEEAYAYMVSHHVALFSDPKAFDGTHGIMAYNRTLQRSGKAQQHKPTEEWIVSVGRHKGVIPGKKWGQAQILLEQNRSESYRKPRSSVALLSGLLVCQNCGGYMRPKATNRTNSNGETVYTYLCSTKERSHGHQCTMKNVNGNRLDAQLLAVLTALPRDYADVLRQLAHGKRGLRGNREYCDAEASKLQEELRSSQTELRALVTALARVSGTPTEDYVTQQINELHQRRQMLHKRLDDWNTAHAGHPLSDEQLPILCNGLCSFHDQIARMTVAQKRQALRFVVKKVVWDGETAHVYLMSDEEDDLEGMAYC